MHTNHAWMADDNERGGVGMATSALMLPPRDSSQGSWMKLFGSVSVISGMRYR